MTIPQINNMLARLDAVRAVFDVGPHSLPFLEEVAIFLKEISPLLEQINDSIRDSTSTMPRATTQLESVS
ncbi:MAG TPA: chemotaxis protein CheZ, partial [Rhodothermales bacterium]|nr:chemotaxis protein CheZ [Rhodothermales bacterium]